MTGRLPGSNASACVIAAVVLAAAASAADRRPEGPARPTPVASAPAEDRPRRIHALGDVSHAYAFGLCWQSGIARSYLSGPGEAFTASHYSLHAIDFEPYNVFIMPLIRSRDLPYNIPADPDHVKQFMTRDGGGVFVFCHIPGKEKPWPNVAKLTEQFGYRHGPHAKGPMKLVDHELTADVRVPTFAGRTLVLAKPASWQVLVRDAEDRPLLAVRPMGKGRLVVTGCDIVRGRREGDKAPHYSLVHKLLVWCSQGKSAQPKPRRSEVGPEHALQLDDITIRHNDYLADFAQTMGAYYQKIRPRMAEWMGVPMRVGQKDEKGKHTGKIDLYLLPCGDAGWSVGHAIGVAVFWGGFPKVKTGVIGVMGHELHHSWIKGYGSNFIGHEAWAIYAGSKMCQKLGYQDAWEAYTARLAKTAASEKFQQTKGLKNPTVTYQIVLWHMEQLYGEDVVKRYFRLREKLVVPTGHRTTDHDAAWLWTQATGEDQFAYLRSMGYDVDIDKVTLPAARAAIERVQWFTDARFGVFLCWSPAAVRKLGDAGWNIAWNRISWADYDAMCKAFNPTEYDPVKVVRQIKQMGAKYIVFTTKHHAGFSMWDTEGTDYNITNSAYGTDVLKPLAEAARAEGVRFGLYFSGWDWHRPEYRGKPRDAADLNGERGGITTEKGNEQWPKFLDYYHLQIRELLSNYGQIDVFWPDAGFPTETFYKMLRTQQPACVVNNRWGDELNRWDFRCYENHIPTKDPGVPWESCLRVAGGWYYVGPRCAPASKIVRTVLTATSRNGNVLLSFPLNEKGAYDQQFVEQMQKVGEWFAANGESVYGCGSTGLRSTYAWGNATARPGHLYVHVYPDVHQRYGGGGPIVLTDLLSEVRSAKLLVGDRAVPCRRDGQDVVLTLPSDLQPDPIATVVDVQIDGRPRVGPPRYVRQWAVLPLPANTAPEHPCQWTTLSAGADGLVDLLTLRGHDKYGGALVAVDIISDADRQTELLLGRSDRGDIYLNGSRVADLRGWEHRPVPDAERWAIRLKKGRNTLVIRLHKGRITEQWGGWGFYAWIAGGKTLTIEPTAPRTFVGNQPASWRHADVVIEAEAAAERSAQAKVATTQPGASGGQYVDVPAVKAPVSRRLTAGFITSRELVRPHVMVRYMCPARTPPKLDVSIDGGKPISLPLVPTRGYHPYWTLAIAPLANLAAGEHRIVLQSTAKEGFQLDAVVLAEGEFVGSGVWK